MESSTPPISSIAASASNAGGGLDNQAIAQDPLALPNEHHVAYNTNDNSSSQDQATVTTQSNTNNNICNSDKNLNNDGSMSTTNNGAIYSNNGEDHLQQQQLLHHHLHHPGMQFDTTNQIGNSHHYNDVRKLNHMSMPPHEPHKTFSHSIENLSKTTEKCSTNDMKM